MKAGEEGGLLRIYVGESDRAHGQSLHEWLVLQARTAGLAGATVTRGLMGYGAHHRLHTFKVERLAEDLPLVVEIVDARSKLERFLEQIEPAMAGGLATLQAVEVRFYRSAEGGPVTPAG